MGRKRIYCIPVFLIVTFNKVIMETGYEFYVQSFLNISIVCIF